MNIFKFFGHSFRKSRLRKIIRGYNSMKSTGGIGFYQDLASTLTLSKFPLVQASCSKEFFGDAYLYAEISIRKFLLQQMSRELHNTVCIWYQSQKPIRYPLPRHWQDLLEASGIKVNRHYSSLFFYTWILLTLLRNIIASLRFQFSQFLDSAEKKGGGCYIFFVGLKENNLPRNLASVDGGSICNSTYDICSWYHRRCHSRAKYEVIAHDLKIPAYSFNDVMVEYKRYPWFFINGLSNKLYLFLWWLWAVFLCVVELLRGRWWYTVMLYECTLSKAVNLVESNQLARSYLFSHSLIKFRPLWTYTCEAKGSEVITYFYSISEQPISSMKTERYAYDYGAITWQKLYVWTEVQRRRILITNTHYKPEITVVGPVWFEDSCATIRALPRGGVAVFPVDSHRIAFVRGTSTLSEWATNFPDLYQRFLVDTSNVLREFGFTMHVKVKREIGVREKKSTIMFHSALAKTNNVYFVDPSISAFRLIKSSLAAISLPFTSTALCTPSLDFPSVYYDPTGWIAKTDKASSGILVVSGIDELRYWVATAVVRK